MVSAYLRVYLIAVEVVLVVCVITAAVTAGWAAVGPAAGLIVWTPVLVVLWPETREG